MLKKFDFYIAGPMRGRVDGNKPLFIRIAAFLRSQGHTVWNPAEQNDRHMTFSQCIENDIDAVIHKCDAIILLPGWRNSLGANVEVLCAYVCNKEIFSIEPSTEQNKPILVPISKEALSRKLKLPFASSLTSIKDFRSLEELDIPEDQVLKK